MSDKFKIKLSEKEKKSTLELLNREHRKARDNQRPARRKWRKIDRFVAGWQHLERQRGIEMNHEGALFPSETENVDDEFMVINEMRRIHLSNMQRMTSYEIRPEVIPDAKTPDSKRGARLGRMALADLFRRNNENKLKKKIARHMTLYGTTFLKVHFDPNRGRLITRVEEKNAFQKLMSKFSLGNESEPEGEIVLDVVSPRNLLLPRLTQELEKADWAEEVQIETTDYVYRTFGKTVEAEDVVSDEDVDEIDIEQKDVELDGRHGHLEDTVVLKSRFYRPSPKYKRGAIFVYTTKELLWSSTLEDFYDDLPFFSAEMIFDDRTVFGEGMMWDLIPLQIAENEIISAMRRHVEMYGDLQLFIPADANLEEGDITNGTARHMIFHGDKAPQFATPPELQATHFNVFGLMRDLMQDLSASHDISRRKGTLSGNAIAFLQEIDDTVMKPALDSVEEMFRQVSEFSLKLMDRFYDTNRLIKMSSFQGWQIEESFRGEMLNGNFHAEINLMSGLPSNKMARLEFLKGLHKDGILTTDEVKAHLEFGASEEIMQIVQKENEVADDKIQKLLDFPAEYVNAPFTDPVTKQPAGTKMQSTVVFHVWDNHELIIKKMLLMMREGYDRWDKPVREGFERELKLHQEAIAAALAPVGPGVGPVGAEIDPTRALTGAAGGGISPSVASQLAPNVPGESAGSPSVHTPGEQPGRGPAPVATGFQQ